MVLLPFLRGLYGFAGGLIIQLTFGQKHGANQGHQ